jgi:phage shock protein C
MKKLYRSQSDVMIAGICSGLADYLGIDPTVVRLIFVVLLFAGLGGLWLYIILWIIMPLEPGERPDSVEAKSQKVIDLPPQLPEAKTVSETEKKTESK